MILLLIILKYLITIIAWDYIAEQQWILLHGKYHFTRGCMLLFPFLITQVLNEAYNIGFFFLENFNSVCLIIRQNIATVIIKLIQMYYAISVKYNIRHFAGTLQPTGGNFLCMKTQARND